MRRLQGTMHVSGLELGPTQAIEHGLQSVNAFLLPKRGPRRSDDDRYLKEGVITSEEVNEHLQFCLVHERSKQDRPFDIVPVTNELQQLGIVTRSLQAEATKLAGTTDGKGDPELGELQKLDIIRSVLLDWTSRSDDKLDTSRSWLGDMSDSRANAINEDNQAVAVVAGEMRTLKDSMDRDNPGAMLAKSLRLAKPLRQRYGSVSRSLVAQAERAARTVGWLVDEDERIGNIYGVAGRLQSDPTEADYIYLVSLIDNIYFHGQPFKHFKQQLAGFGGELPDADPLRELQQNILFLKEKNYLVTPLRQLGALTIEALRERKPAYVEADHAALQARIERLEELDLTGPTNDLRGRVITGMREVQTGLKTGIPEQIQHVSVATGTLLVFQCVPGHPDSLTQAFYGRKPGLAKTA